MLLARVVFRTSTASEESRFSFVPDSSSFQKSPTSLFQAAPASPATHVDPPHATTHAYQSMDQALTDILNEKKEKKDERKADNIIEFGRSSED